MATLIESRKAHFLFALEKVDSIEIFEIELRLLRHSTSTKTTSKQIGTDFPRRDLEALGTTEDWMISSAQIKS